MVLGKQFQESTTWPTPSLKNLPPGSMVEILGDHEVTLCEAFLRYGSSTVTDTILTLHEELQG